MARVVIPGFRKIEVSGGGGGTNNYNDLTNKPSINNVPLVGNLRTVDLKLTDATLTEEGVPAEAKTVGTKLEGQSTSLTTLKKETTVNLLKTTLATTTKNGVTCTNNGDGTYTLNGTASETFEVRLADDIHILKGKYYSCLTKEAINDFYMSLWYSSNELYGVADEKQITITNQKSLSPFLHFDSGAELNNVVIKPMFTTNLNATYDDFVPYTGDSGKLNSDVASLLKRIETLESLLNKTDTTNATVTE